MFLGVKSIRACLIFCFLLCSTLTSFAEESRPLKVALNLPLSGGLAVYGKSVEEGVRIALDEEAGIKDLLELDFQDNEGMAKNAVTIANKQLNSSPDIYVSGIKPQQMAIKDILAKVDVPHFEWIFDVNVRPNGEKNNFRTWVNFKDEPQIFIEYAKELHAKKVAIIYVSLPSTDEEYNTLIVPGLKSLGADVYVQPYQMDLTDFAGMVLNVRKYKPDLLIISGFAENLPPMIKRLNEQNLVKNKNIISTYDLIDAIPLVRPEWMEGLRVAAPLFLTRKDEDLNIKSFYERFKTKYGRDPIYTHAYAYDMAKILIEASKVKSKEPTKHLSDIIQGLDLEGITSRLKFNEEGSLPLSIERAVVRSGKVVRDIKAQ